MRAHALLLGRRSYDWFASRWSSRSGNTTHRKPLRLVSSTTLGDGLPVLVYDVIGGR